MKGHLTDEQIEWYIDTASDSVESIGTGRRLIQLEDCRKRMPPPPKEQFPEAIVNDIDEEVIEEANRLDGISGK
jgi:hypothetical protein